MEAIEAPPMVGFFHLHDASLHVHNDAGDIEWCRGAFHTVMRRLRRLGFNVGRDPRIERDFKLLGPSHRAGNYRDLEFVAEYFPRGLRIEFFQNIVFENRSGGQYDFDRVAKMPYLIRKRFDWTIVRLRRLLTRLALKEKLPGPSIYTAPIEHYRHMWGSHPRSFGPDGRLLESAMPKWGRQGMDGIPLHTGDMKYARSNGRLVRGRVHGGINGMWFLVHSVGQIEPVGVVENQNAGWFFSCDHPERLPRRWFPAKKRRARRAEALAKAIKHRDWKRVAVLGPIVDRERHLDGPADCREDEFIPDIGRCRDPH